MLHASINYFYESLLTSEIRVDIFVIPRDSKEISYHYYDQTFVESEPWYVLGTGPPHGRKDVSNYKKALDP